jgi:hypothetical protein
MSDPKTIEKFSPAWERNRSVPVLIMAMSSKINELIDEVTARREGAHEHKKRVSKVDGADTKA